MIMIILRIIIVVELVLVTVLFAAITYQVFKVTKPLS